MTGHPACRYGLVPVRPNDSSGVDFTVSADSGLSAEPGANQNLECAFQASRTETDHGRMRSKDGRIVKLIVLPESRREDGDICKPFKAIHR
jgi:hypothetical protein